MKTQRKIHWLWIVVALVVALLFMLLVSPTALQHPADAAVPDRAPAQTWDFSGHVYEGVPPGTTPLQNVTVRLYGSIDAGSWGTELASTATDANGEYKLSTERQGFEFFHIVETDPPGYNAAAAQSGSGGTVVNNNWIRFDNPVSGEYDGNNFWDRRPPTETPLPTLTSSPTHEPHPTYTPTATPATPEPTPTIDPNDPADLSIRKFLDTPPQGPIAPGGPVRFRLEVLNRGPATARNVIVEDVLPPGFSFHSASPGCTVATSGPPHDIVRCELGDMPPSPPTKMVWIQADVGAQVCGRATNEAMVSSDTSEDYLWNNDDFLQIIIAPCNRPAVLVEKTQLTPPDFQTYPGDTINYQIKITNIGDTPLDRVSLLDRFDSRRLTYLDAAKTPHRILTGPEEGRITWLDLTLPPPFGFARPLNPGEEFDLRARFRADQTGSAQNCADVMASSGDIVVEDTSCYFSYIRGDSEGLLLEKELRVPESGVATVGQNVQFMVFVQNHSGQPIVGIRLRDEYDETVLDFRGAVYDPDDDANDGVLDWSNLTGPAPGGFDTPLAPGSGRGFSVSFLAEAVTPPGQPSENCVRAWYWHEDQVEIEVPEVCASVVVVEPRQVAMELEKTVLFPPGGLALPGNPVHFRFKVANTGATTLTQITLDDLYDADCLSFVPFNSAPQDPDDLDDDGALHWEKWLNIGSLEPGWSVEALPGAKFQAKAGADCDPTENTLQAIITDEHGATVQDQAEADVFIFPDPSALSDLGDAPASANHAGATMTAYPGVQADFPTVFDPGIGAFGPAHKQPRVGPWLGRWVSREANADVGPDEDGNLNIVPGANIPNRDHDDDGLQRPLVLKHCQPTAFDVTVTFPAGALDTGYYLNAWLDWDRDGKWGAELECGADTVSEWAVRNQTVAWQPAGTVTFSSTGFTAWNQADSEPLWLRITLSEQPATRADGGGPADAYEYGETEDYIVRDGGHILYLPLILQAYDVR